jgi:fructose-specific phosphotransferase system IIC component
MNRAWPKRIGYIGGTLSAVAGVVLSKPKSAVEASQIGGATAVAGFLVAYLLGWVIFQLSRALRRSSKGKVSQE